MLQHRRFVSRSRLVGILLVACAATLSSSTTAAAFATPRIIGGGAVQASSVPWTVAIMHTSQSNGYNAQFCGGSLIDQQWVLTAAHCIVGETAASVDVGWGQTLLSSMTAANRHAVSAIVKHPEYNANLSTSDVALLKLATPVPGAATIDLNAVESWPVLNDALDTYGWGNISTTGTNYPDDLHGVQLVDMAGPSGACGNYGSSYVSLHMLCAGVSGGGKDACQGDSGGPIVGTFPGGSAPLLVGVTSWGNGCAQNGYPGLWSRVSTYYPWIQKTMFQTLPTYAIGNTTITEGDTGTRLARFTVTLSRKSSTPVTIPYSTFDGDATAGSDYSAKSGTLNFPAGTVTKPVTVTIKSDSFREFTEDFSVVLGAASGATPLNYPFSSIGTGTVFDDDPNGAVAMAIADADVYEGDAGASQSVSLTVSLANAASGPVTVQWQTVSGTATAGSDYVAKSGTLSFATGAKTKVIKISVKPDFLPEGYADESFTVVLSNLTGGAIFANNTAVINILGDDS